jgi:hypothetical protein
MSTIAADADLLAQLYGSAAALINRAKPSHRREVDVTVRAMAAIASNWAMNRAEEWCASTSASGGAEVRAALARAPRPPPLTPGEALWLRPKDAARAAGISRSLLYEWMKAPGRVVTRKVGGCRLILLRSLLELEDVPSGRNGRPQGPRANRKLAEQEAAG